MGDARCPSEGGDGSVDVFYLSRITDGVIVAVVDGAGVVGEQEVA